MLKKRHPPKEIMTKLHQVDVITTQGRTLDKAIRSIGVAKATYHRWHSDFGRLKLDQVRRLKELELENGRIKRTAPGWLEASDPERGGALMSKTTHEFSLEVRERAIRLF